MAAIRETNRSVVMAAIRSKNTRPELLLRMALRRRSLLGYRCHLRGLPGCPDIAFSRSRVAIFVDGAYWHGHPAFIRPNASTYWDAKIERNRARDRESEALLQSMGWAVMRFWDFDVVADADLCADAVGKALKRMTPPHQAPGRAHRQGS